MSVEKLVKTGIESFCSLRSFSTPVVSPNGQQLCFIAHQPDLEQNKNVSDLWLYTPETGARRLTTSGSDRHPRWLNDHELLFISKRGSVSDCLPVTVFYTIDVRGGEAVKSFEVPFEVSRFETLANGNFVFEYKYQPDLNGLTEDKERLEKIEEKDAFTIIDEIPFWSNGEGYTNKTRTALCLYTMENSKVDRLTDQLSNVEDWAIDYAETRLALIQNKFRDKQVAYNSLAVYSFETCTLTDLSHRDDFVYERCTWSPDGNLLFFGSDMAAYGINQNGSFYIMAPDTSQVTPLTPDFDGVLGSSVTSDVKLGSTGSTRPFWYQDQWVFVSTVNSNAQLMAIDQSGSVKSLFADDMPTACFEFANLRGALVIFAQVSGLPQELYEVSKDSHSAIFHLTRLTSLNVEALNGQFVADPEEIHFTASDGTALTGWILKPYGFDPTRRCTGILNIHGGPKTVYGPHFNHEMQYWASEGFAVMFMNPRGSDGRGNAFADMRGRYGTVDYDDLMLFTDVVVERYPWIDSDRLGVTGGSYGGFMTNWIIGHTQRFRAAASQRSISNWISKFGTTDIGYFFVPDQIGADPWSDFETLWDRSPLKYASQVKTPTLFIHSDEDFRCWSAEAYQMFTALKYHGIKSRLCLFHGENHELSRSGKPKNRIRRLQEITDWMKSHL
jgi:dipeptidyl aminopeptidase/acylaminoacyl peptidase